MGFSKIFSTTPMWSRGIPGRAEKKKKDFSVTITREEKVAAASPLPKLWLPLSNMDLTIPPIDFSAFACYKKPAKGSKHHNLSSMIDTLRGSLAQVLMKYYALSGEVVANSAGEPELLCNGHGVDFLEAYADVELEELMLYDLDNSIGRGMLPMRRDGVLSLQVTGLRCGGIVIACTFDHRMLDGYSTNMFLASWADCARSRSISIIPSFRRSLLNPRRPYQYSASIANLFMPMPSPPLPENLDTTLDHLTDHIFYINAGDIDKLQALASSGKHKKTKFEAFSAYMWQTLSRCARPGTKTSKLSIPVDGRTRLSDKLEGNRLDTYFGNVISPSNSILNIEEMKAMDLCEVSDVVHANLQVLNSKEYYLQVIDFVELCRPTLVTPKFLCRGEVELLLVVSSGKQFATLNKLDYGWGNPVMGSISCYPWDMEYVMPMPSARKNGDWLVYTRILKEHFRVFEAEVRDVLHPVTSDYLGLVGDLVH